MTEPKVARKASDNPNLLERELHGLARLLVHLGRKDGFSFDKRVLRYNEIVETAFRYGRCSDPFSEAAAYAGLREAVYACSPDIVEMYARTAVTSLCPVFLCGTEDPRQNIGEGE